MPDAYWYLGLVVISLVLLSLALLHRKDWKLLVLHLSISSIIQPFEVVVLTTGGYLYKPGILSFPPGADNFLGAYISDFFIVPASAVAINAFSLSPIPVLCVTAAFTGIDWLFTILDIYRHFWWKSIYTGIGLIIFYAISGWLWANLKQQCQSLLFRLLIIHLTFFAIQSVIFFAINKGGLLFEIQLPYLQPSTPEILSILMSSYQLIVSITVVICMGLKTPYHYRLLGVGPIIALNWAIGYFGIFVPHINITPYHLMLLSAAAAAMLIILFRAAKLDYLFP